MNSLWIPVAVAIVGAVGGYFTARASKEKSKSSSAVEDAAKVNQMAVGYAEKMQKDLNVAWEELRFLRTRVGVLEKEVIRLGGDPHKLNGKEDDPGGT